MLALFLSTLFLGPIPLSPQEVKLPFDQQAGPNYEVLFKELEIMRRILVREALGQKEGESTLFRQTVRSFYPRNAFYLPGEGAVFLLHVDHAVAPAWDSPPARSKSPTLWDEVQAELEGRSLGSPTNSEGSYDDERVEALKRALIKVLTTYARHLTQLHHNDHLSVVVSGTDEAVVQMSLSSSPLVPRLTSTGLAFRSQAPSVRGSTTLVVRVSLSDLERFRKGPKALDQISERALFAQY